MHPTSITITLKSAATFGSGDSVPGLVDREIEHDPAGFPFLRGKTLKGLLAESAENVVFALEEQGKTGWKDVKKRLFGTGGRGSEERGMLHIGDAELSAGLRSEVTQAGWKPEEVLYSLTGIRRQTSINEHGAPDHATLRAMRVLLPGVSLTASLSFEREPDERDLQLLAAAVLDFRRAGTGRNRGRGWLEAGLGGGDKSLEGLFMEFAEAIQ
jgi:hypothetical protein